MKVVCSLSLSLSLSEVTDTSTSSSCAFGYRRLFETFHDFQTLVPSLELNARLFKLDAMDRAGGALHLQIKASNRMAIVDHCERKSKD